MEATGKKLTPEKVVQILKKHGTEVSIEEAAIIINYINEIARIAVSQYLRGD